MNKIETVRHSKCERRRGPFGLPFFSEEQIQSEPGNSRRVSKMLEQ